MSAQKALLAAATLSAGTTIDRWSRVGALATLIPLIILPSISLSTGLSLCLSLLVALVQALYATRTALDERVFAQWSQHGLAEARSPNDHLGAFDSAVHDQFGRNMKPRTLDARIRSAMGLLQQQALALGIQLLLLALGIVRLHWGA